jgi:hypothetical protein
MDWYNLTLEQWLNSTLSSWVSLPLVATTTSLPVTVDRTKYFYCRTPGLSAVYKYVRWRWFYTRCPKLNMSCNSKRGAFCAAITVCNQQLWQNDFGQDQ